MANNKKVLVGMSGGLDSTYTVKLLQDEGYDVTGIALVFSEFTDVSAARRAAEELGTPLEIIDCKDKFNKYVVSDFASEYLSGLTPNPCVVCNRYVKMQTLFEQSEKMGCVGFATGHYCRTVRCANGRYAIARADDQHKDQSYMLWGMTQEQIAKFIAPLASLNKNDIRSVAYEKGFSSASSKESQDICFIPDGDYVSYIKKNFKDSPCGEFEDTEGNVLGRHNGILNYTVGQRKGLGIALGYHAYITKINPITNRITLAKKEDSYIKSIRVDKLNFQSLEPTECGEFDCTVKIRYAAKPAECHVVISGDTATVIFGQEQRTPAPGQSAVFYDENGVISFSGFIYETL